MKIDRDIMSSLLFFADSVKIDGRDLLEKPRLRDVENAKMIQIANEHHVILIMQDERIATISIMKGYGYKDSFMAVFLYEFGKGRIEKHENGRLVEKTDCLNKRSFTSYLKKEGVPYIAL